MTQTTNLKEIPIAERPYWIGYQARIDGEPWSPYKSQLWREGYHARRVQEGFVIHE